MTYTIAAYDDTGRLLRKLGARGNIAAARQAMLDDANIVDLAAEEPFFCPGAGVMEGWFIGRTEYLIEVA